jgi:hypothetical protein
MRLTNAFGWLCGVALVAAGAWVVGAAVCGVALACEFAGGADDDDAA